MCVPMSLFVFSLMTLKTKDAVELCVLFYAILSMSSTFPVQQ